MRSFATAKPTTEHKPSQNHAHGQSPYETALSQAVSSFSAPVIQRKAGCACGGGCPACQAKSTDLSISQPNDPAEIEADAIADKVMRMPVGEAKPININHHSPALNQLHTKCAECEEEEDVPEPVLQKEAFASASPHSNPADGIPNGNVSTQVMNVINSGGRPLDQGTRSFFEPRFGIDFGHVRIHTDAAAGIARSINAKAFNVGRNIVFGAGQYQPESHEGKRLLAHELTHVVQKQSLIQRKVEAPQVPAPAEQMGASRPADPGVGEGIDVTFILTSAPGDEPPQKDFIEGMTSYVKNVLRADNVYDVKGLKEMFEMLDNLGKYGDKKVRRIRIVGHGFDKEHGGKVLTRDLETKTRKGMKSTLITPTQVREFAKIPESRDIITRAMQPGAVVEFWGCNLGKYPEAREAWANLFQSTFVATKEKVAARFFDYSLKDRHGKRRARSSKEVDRAGPIATKEFDEFLLRKYKWLVDAGEIAEVSDDPQAIVAHMRDMFDRSSGEIDFIAVQKEVKGVKGQFRDITPDKPKDWNAAWVAFPPMPIEALANENAPAPAEDKPAPTPVSLQPPVGSEAASPGATPPSEVHEPPPIPTDIPVREPTEAPPIPTDIPVREPTGEWAMGGQSATPMSPPMAEQPPRKTTPEPTRPVSYSSDCLAAESSPSGVVFGRIPFASDHADVAHPADLERFVGLLGANRASWSIRVDGYASTDGPEDYNFRLSCRRAQTVRDQLMRLGVPASHVTTYAHGEASEFSATNRAENRVAIVSASPGSGLETVRTPSQRLPGEETVSRHDRRDEPHLVSTGVQAAAMVARMLPTSRPITVSQMGWVTLTPGMVFDDEMMLIAADSSVVYYAQGHSLYRMSTSTFLRSLWFGSLTKAAKSASVWSKVAEIEAALLEAIFVPWYILAAVNLAGAVLTYVARKDQVDKVVGNALRAARRTLHLVQEFYQLYPNLSKRLMWRLGNEMIRNLPVLFLTLAREIELDDIAFFVGRLIHHDWIKAGAQVAWVPAIATGPAHKVIAKTALQVFALHSPKLAERAVERYVEESISAFRANMHDEGVEMSDEEARVLLREMALHPDVSQRMKVIEAALQDLGPALEALSKTLTPKGVD